MGESQVAVPPAPSAEISEDEVRAAHRVIIARICQYFRGIHTSKGCPISQDKLEEGLSRIKGSIGLAGAVDGISALAEQFAAATITKHLAIIANDPHAIKAFCPKCGRHYRYHNKMSGECPVHPFGEAESET